MALFRSSKLVLFLVSVAGLAPLTASASVSEYLSSRSFEPSTADMTILGLQYVQEISLDMCSWENRPVNSICTAENPGDSSSTWNQQNAVSCGAPTGPRPTTYWFDLSASVPCIYGNMGCRTQQWTWADGRYLSGAGWQVLHCPSNPADMGTGLFTKPMASTRSNHVYLRVPGFFAHPQPRVVRGQVKAMLYAGKPYGPSGYPDIAMSATLELQVLNSEGTWEAKASQVIPAPYYSAGLDYSLYEVQALVNPGTPVRVELRANTLPPLVFPFDPNSFERNYRLIVDVIDARLILPECIPDQSNPGQCL